MAKTFSLCLTTRSVKNKDRSFLFRLADITGNELKEYSSYDQDSKLARKKGTHCYPNGSSASYVIGELRIWEWDPSWNKSSNKWAQKTSITFYELITISNIVSLTDEKIIELLKDGQVIPDYFGQKALLVIEEDEEDYKVIELDSSVINNVNNVIRLKDTAIKLKGYKLNKKDFISTEKVWVVSSEGNRLTIRKIYKYLRMKTPDFQIDTLSFNEKMELFINKQVKIRNFPKAQQNNIKDLFIEILSDYDKINEFFHENGFNSDGLLEKVNNICRSINDVFSDTNLWDKFCKIMIENLPELTDKYIQQIEKRFKENNKKRLDKEEQEILSKEEIKNKLTNQCKEYETNLANLEEKKKNLQQNIKDIENTYNSLKVALTNKVSELKENMGGVISETTLLELMDINVNRNVEDKKSYCMKLSNDIKNDIDDLYSINEFVDALGENLKIAGVELESKLTVSKFITGSIRQRNGVLLVGKFTRNIADAISVTMCGMTADIISVISPDIDLSKTIEIINSCNSKVVLIENILNLNEFMALQLLRIGFNKLVLFSNDVSETVNFIPNSLLSRFNLLCLDFICERSTHEKFDFTDSSNIKFENKYNNLTYKAAKEGLDKLMGKCIYSNSHSSAKSELVSLIDDIGEKEGLYSWLLCEAIPHQILLGEKDTLMEIIDTLQLSEKHINKLRRIIG